MFKTKKYWLIFSILILFFSVSFFVDNTKAEVSLSGCGDVGPILPKDNFRASATLSTGQQVNKDGCLVQVFNRSGNSYFVPNKTINEWNSFKTNVPKYVTASVCGDGLCGEGENKYNCPDCVTPTSLPYCGDNFCNNRVICSPGTKAVTIPRPNFCNVGWVQWLYSFADTCYFSITGEQWQNICSNSGNTVFVPTQVCKTEGIIGGDIETWETCPDDCLPTSGSGCGACGYDGSNNICPNWCNGGSLDLVNCVFSESNHQPFLPYSVTYKDDKVKNFFLAAQALAIEEQTGYLESQTYTAGMSWGCGEGIFNPCPAGKYCYPNGLSSSPQTSCPEGYFCPEKSWYARICPPGTYSTGGAEACSSCPPGKYSMPGATSEANCFETNVSGDGVCQILENPKNSNDCPDSYSQSPYSGVQNLKFFLLDGVTDRQTSFYSDGRCSGVENQSTDSPFYSTDCFCGNGQCDNNESIASCYIDCACGNNICDSSNSILKPIYAQGLNETALNCSLDCRCGDNVCDTSESLSSCSADCRCGNRTCEPTKGENKTTCPADCKCGNGTCDSAFGETPYNCSDCHCGNGTCDVTKGERSYNCSTDCTCGDGLCDPDETALGCMADCHCGNYTCNNNAPYYENSSNCPSDCGGLIIKPEQPIYELE